MRSRKGLGERSHGRLDSDRRARQSEVAKPPTLETTMQVAADRTDASTAIQTDLPAIFASLELSRSTWLITSLSPGAGEKMSKHSIRAGDVADLLVRLGQLKEKARGRTGRDFPIIAIQEAGLDGFWIHRVLQSEGIELLGDHAVWAGFRATKGRRRCSVGCARRPWLACSRWRRQSRKMGCRSRTGSNLGVAQPHLASEGGDADNGCNDGNFEAPTLHAHRVAM